MILRNGKRILEMPEIDFDAASKAWRLNKISLPNGMFAYKKDTKDTSGDRTPELAPKQESAT